jgi:hypothetical protein
LVAAGRASRIERTYRFKDFRAAFAFVARIAELAEAEGHHPDISFGWGYATVSLRTKKIKGCTRTTSSWRRSSTASPVASGQCARRAEHAVDACQALRGTSRTSWPCGSCAPLS